MIIDGYKYRQILKWPNGRKWWCCIFKGHKKCTAKCRTFGNTLEITNADHNHYADFTRDDGIVYFTPAIKNPIMILDLYEFKIERKLPDKSLWCCRYNKKTKCRARCVTFGKTLEIRRATHNHKATFKAGPNLACQTLRIIKGKMEEREPMETFI